MACSVPVIATDVGGVRDLLGNSQSEVVSDGFKICERGILCIKNDAKEFANGVKYLVEARQGDREEIVNCARIFVKQKYSKQRLINDIEATYFKLMEKGPEKK